MREQYKELYFEKKIEFESFINKNSQKKISGPLLISPPSIYTKQKNKIMIIGQETKGWWSELPNIDQQMKRTEEFNLGKNYNASPFWNYFHKLENIFENDKYSSLWTNIHKFDLNDGKLDSQCEKDIKIINKILIEEIEIGKPDICIFFTSHSRDKDLKEIFNDIEFIKVKGWDIKELAIIKHKKIPKFSIRTYHPKYIRMQKNEEHFFETIKKLKEIILL